MVFGSPAKPFVIFPFRCPNCFQHSRPSPTRWRVFGFPFFSLLPPPASLRSGLRSANAALRFPVLGPLPLSPPASFLRLPRSPPLQRCKRDRVNLKASAIFGGVNRSGCADPDHALLVPCEGHCRRSSHRSRNVGHGSCRGTGERGAIIQPSHAGPSDNRTLCKVAAYASTLRLRSAYGYIT